RPLAWAEVVRPFGARLGISSISTPGVQQKMWDTIRRGRGKNNSYFWCRNHGSRRQSRVDHSKSLPIWTAVAANRRISE
ncbi:MAG: hypothetical protein ABSA59_22180, partial [Terriglobia bacterium]